MSIALPVLRAFRNREPVPETRSNVTDPEGEIMDTSTEGVQQCYNAQVTVEDEYGRGPHQHR